MKNFKITIYNLILLILILLIIIILCTISITNANKKTRLEKFVSEMELIQEKVNQVKKEYITWENYNANEQGNFLYYLQSLGYSNANSASNIYIDKFNSIINTLNNDETKYWNKNIDSILTNYCYFNSENLKKHFDIDTKLNVIINFYTGNVIERDGINDVTNKNEIIYRQYDTKIGNRLSTISISNTLETMAEVVENNGLSQRIKISFNQKENLPNISEVYYYLDEIENAKSCTELQDYIYIREENAVYFTVNKSGNYYFSIKDINHIEYKADYLEINLCNKPKLLSDMVGIYWDEDGNEVIVEDENNPDWYNYSSELRFANSKTLDGNYWVWIPRFLYNVVENQTTIEFAYENTNKTTNNKLLNNYKVQESFNEQDGFWISKFQANEDSFGNIFVNPGHTLIVTSMKKVLQNLNNYKLDVNVMSQEERNALLIMADSNKIEIANDLVHYAGGGVNSNDFIENTRYSSTGNVYGVYDLITSENELTKESLENEIGRYRLVIKSNQR